MHITFDPDLYHVGNGRFLARFRGIKEYDNPKAIGKNGEKIPPGYMWVFQLQEGEDKGKEASKLTTKQPTLKNSCGKMLMAVAGRELGSKETINLDDYVGAFYMVTIREGYVTDSPPPVCLGFDEDSARSAINALRGAYVPPPIADDEPMPF
jgi:hypothetical protein